MTTLITRVRRSGGHWTVPVTVLTGLAVLALTTTTASARSGHGWPVRAQGDGCTALELILVPGTGEGTANASTPTGLLKPVADGLQQTFGTQLRTYTVPYKAVAFTDGTAYADSKNEGVDLTRRELDRLAGQCPDTKVALIGYSQGADVAGDVACEIGSGAGAIAATAVVGVGLVSDPRRGTTGETRIGPGNDNEGIMGPRTDCGAGFGALTGRVASICIDGDLYCGVDAERDSVLVGIADILGNVTTGDTSTAADSGGQNGSHDEQALVQSLVSDFSQADLGGLPGDITALGEAARTNDSDSVARLSAKIADTLTPLADIVTSATDDPAIEKALDAAAAGSPEAVTGTVLDAAKSIDLDKAIDTASRLATTALGGRTSGTGTTTSADSSTASLTDSATALSQQVTPLTDTGGDHLATAAKILSTVKPQVWVDQITNVASGSLSLAANLPQILEALGKLGPILLDGNLDIWAKVAQLREVAGTLNTLFEPVVKMAAKVDLKTAASLIAMIPDPQGIAPIVSTVVDLLANVDLIAVANEVGRIQNVAWDVLQSCETGCNLLLATPLISSGLTLATLAVDALSGGGEKTDPDQLGQTSDGTALSDSLTQLANGTDGNDGLGKLLQQGLDAASFYGSGVHQDYAQHVVDRSGRTTLTWLTDWLTAQFNKALGV
ncbi:cutinase family protein [Nocardia sp. IFM 10818]